MATVIRRHHSPERPIPDGQPDAVLIAHARNDRSSFAALYDRYFDAIYRYCFARLGSAERAEDAAHQVFVRALEAVDRYQEVGRFRSWLFTIARNAVIDAVRGRGRRPALHAEADQAAQLADPSDTFARYDTAEEVYRGLAGLTPDGRAILTAIFIEELTYEQAASRLGIPVGTAKSRVYYALRALRAQLDGTTMH